MGAWSYESFGNDDACDWAGQLTQQDDFQLVESTLDTVITTGDDYLEAPEACEAIAAAEVIARARGNFGLRDACSENVDAWVARMNGRPSAALIDKASQALDRILTEPSELMELWEESGDGEPWRKAIIELKIRVGDHT